MPNRRVPLLVALLLAAACHHTATTVSPASVDFPVAEIEKLINAEMTARNIPGLSIAIARDRQLRWTSAYGQSDIENGIPAKPATMYRLASVSKMFTAVAAMQLAEAGALDLDAPVQRYVPSFPQKQWPVTARQLLSHTGGIRHYNDGEPEHTTHYDDVVTALEIFANDPLKFEPGTQYLYSSYGYNLLGAVVQGAAGKPFVDVLREKIWVPAGMEKTRDDSIFAVIPNRAQGYSLDDDGQLVNSELVDTSYKIPSGGLTSTAEELAKFGVALQSDKLVKPETREQMWTVVNLRDGTPNEDAYGYGCWMMDHNGRREVIHTGGQARVSTVLYQVPAEGLSIAILCNQEYGKMFKLAQSIGDLLAQGQGAHK